MEEAITDRRHTDRLRPLRRDEAATADVKHGTNPREAAGTKVPRPEDITEVLRPHPRQEAAADADR